MNSSKSSATSFFWQVYDDFDATFHKVEKYDCVVNMFVERVSGLTEGYKIFHEKRGEYKEEDGVTAVRQN